MGDRAYWTTDELRKLRECASRGYTLAQAAEVIGRSFWSVKGASANHNISFGGRGSKTPRLVEESREAEPLPGSRRPWTNEEDAVILECVAKGKTPHDAHALLRHRSADRCYRRAFRLGKPFPSKRSGFQPKESRKERRAVDTRLFESFAEVKARKEADRQIIREKAIALGIPTAYRPWADVVRDVEKAA